MTASARLIDLITSGPTASRPTDPTTIAKGAIYAANDGAFLTTQWNGSAWVLWAWGGRPLVLCETGDTVADFETANGVTVPAGAIIVHKP